MIDSILSRLSKVKKTGPHNWLACCPAHDDKNPSMTIRAEDDGRILVKCHSGCSFDEIVGAVGMGWEPWFPPKSERERAETIRRAFPAGDVLEALEFEALIVALTAAELATRGEITDVAKKRMWIAYDRISEGRRLALGER